MTVYINGKSITLTQRNYVAEGGEGKVFAVGDVGYKIYHDPKKMIPLGKIKELQAINNPNIIRPLDILTDKVGNPIGYTMRFIKDAWCLCQVFPKAFRDRNKVTHDMIRKMVTDLQKLMSDVHDAGVLIVDANEMNFLVTKNFEVVLGIDADSYQTSHYPATAIMLSIRDWSIKNDKWTEYSDWYSFACVSFQMFTGIHPFKGKHPNVNGMAARMKASISVLDSKVGVPGCTYDFSVIPSSYMEWYKRLFVKNERCLPPNTGGTVNITMTKHIPLKGNGQLTLNVVYEHKDDIVRYWVNQSTVVAVTSDSILIDNRTVSPNTGNIEGCAFTISGVPIIVYKFENTVILEDIQNRRSIPFNMTADEISGIDGRIYIRSKEHVYELILTETGDSIIATTKIIANILPNASKLYRGVIMQSMLGSLFASLLPRTGASYQIRIPELDSYRILDAKYESGVLMAIGECKGVYDRIIMRFDEDFEKYDIRVVKDIQPAGMNFTVLDTGICACLNEDGNLELFSKRKDSAAIKEIDDNIIPGMATIGKMNGVVLISYDNKISEMRMVK